METISLKAEKRETKGKKVSELRNNGYVPAIVYGKDMEPESLQIEKKALDKAYRMAGETALIDLDIDGKVVKVLIAEVQNDPLTDANIHVDFHKVNLAEEIKTDVPLEYENEEIAPAIKELGGIMVKEKDSIEVECLPTDIPHEIVVDLSVLATFEDMLRVEDLKVPANVKVMNDPDEVVALVKPPRSEEELDALNEEVVEDVEKVESVEGVKAEEGEAEGAEGKKEE